MLFLVVVDFHFELPLLSQVVLSFECIFNPIGDVWDDGLDDELDSDDDVLCADEEEEVGERALLTADEVVELCLLGGVDGEAVDDGGDVADNLCDTLKWVRVGYHSRVRYSSWGWRWAA